MNAEEFCYWLHGYFEIGGLDELTQEQVATIREHLNLVFTNVTSGEPSEPRFIPSDTRFCGSGDNIC